MEGWRLQSERYQGKLQQLAWEIKEKEGKEVSHVDIQREDYSRQKNSTNVLKWDVTRMVKDQSSETMGKQ